MTLARSGPSRVVQRRAPCLKGVHPQLLEAPPDRLATPGGGGGQLLVALQPQPGRIDFSKSQVMHWNAEKVQNKKTELEHILHERSINACCIQEANLHSRKPFKIGG